MGTISLEKSYPGYNFSREIVPIQVRYDFSWVHFLLGTISPDTTRCPSSTRPSSLTFIHIFDLFSATAERNSTKVIRKQDLKVLYHLDLWLVEIFSTSSLPPLNGIQRNLTGCKISTSAIKFVFLADRKIKMGALSSDQKRHYDLNVFYQFCDFRSDCKTKIAALASDWPIYFRPLLYNGWMEFSKTWQEARWQCPLPNSSFSGPSEIRDGRLGLWLVEKFSTTSLHSLNGIQWNLAGSKISTSSTKFVFFGSIENPRWQSWPLIYRQLRLHASAERDSTKLDNKQDLNVL